VEKFASLYRQYSSSPEYTSVMAWLQEGLGYIEFLELLLEESVKEADSSSGS
jgi:hypothetical protein